MAQFDVYANPNVAQRAAYPLFVDIQSNQLDSLQTRLVMPLVDAPTIKRLPKRLSVKVKLNGHAYLPVAHLCAAMPAGLLKKPVGHISDQQHILRDALDATISGI